MTETAEILTSLREAKKVLSEEYAETFCFLIEQIEAALLNMETAVKIKDETKKELADVRFFTEIINLFSKLKEYENNPLLRGKFKIDALDILEAYEMGVLIYLNLTSQDTTTASAGSLGGKRRSANFIEVKEFVTAKYQEIAKLEPDIKNVVAASRIEKIVSGKYTPFPLTETNIRNLLAGWISSLKKHGKIP